MRNLFAPIALVAAVAFSGAAFAAATEVTGVIKSIDAKAETVTLEDGKVYHLPKGFKLEAFKAGAKVTLKAETKDGKEEATEMMMAK